MFLGHLAIIILGRTGHVFSITHVCARVAWVSIYDLHTMHATELINGTSIGLNDLGVSFVYRISMGHSLRLPGSADAPP